MYSGGFSVAFPVNVDGEKFCFRCWHTSLGNIGDRLKKLSLELKNVQLPYFCDFKYVNKGIVVDGKIMPITRMKWIEGDNLVSYICKHRNRRDLQNLAKNFYKMCIELHKCHIAHGDLQHGNILVNGKGEIFLIDYDSVYMPALGEQEDIITGKKEYQHPKRKYNKNASEKLDYFSELIIYIGIMAISESPNLIEKYNMSSEEDSFLFNSDDYDNLENSQIYNDIHSLGETFIVLLDILKTYLSCSDINELEPFMNILFANKISFTCSPSKLTRGKNKTTVLKWEVPASTEVKLYKTQKIEPIETNIDQNFLYVDVNEDTSYYLVVESEDGIRVEKKLDVEIYDESAICFYADKNYSYPSLPIVLSWKVSHAQKIFLDSEEVMSDGCKIVYPDKSTTYTLSTENELGKNQKVVKIEMLPIPLIKTIMVPVPDIKRDLHINIKRSQYNANLNLPEIKTKLIDIVYPSIPSLTDLGINVTLSPPLERFSIRKTIKNIYNKLIKKQNENREKTNTINLQ